MPEYEHGSPGILGVLLKTSLPPRLKRSVRARAKNRR
jgi:hypothetical protein